MKKIVILSLFFSCLAFSGKNVISVDSPVIPVTKENPFYIGLGLLWSGISRDCPCNDSVRNKDSVYGFIGRIGYDFNPYIGIEARALKSDIDINFAETIHYGLYLKPQYQINKKFNIYGLFGYGYSEIDCSFSDFEIYSDSGLSLGLGFEYDLSSIEENKGFGLWVDYQNLLNNEGSTKIDSNIISAGIVYDF